VMRRRLSWEGSVGAPPASMEDADDRSYGIAASRHGEGAGMGARSVMKSRSSRQLSSLVSFLVARAVLRKGHDVEGTPHSSGGFLYFNLFSIFKK
jgi:hypothetical protein